MRTPWYQVLSNPVYAEDFYYIGAFIPEREKLIVDGDEEEGNDCEQSDIIMILLNLGSIPDEVAKKFDFKPGFQKEFLQNMQNYREEFQNKFGVKWGFMDELVIERYLTFKRSRQALTENLKNRGRNHNPSKKMSVDQSQVSQKQGLLQSQSTGPRRVEIEEEKKINMKPELK